MFKTHLDVFVDVCGLPTVYRRRGRPVDKMRNSEKLLLSKLLVKPLVRPRPELRGRPLTTVQLVFNPFSPFVPQLELYSQLQLSLWSDPTAFSVPRLTC